jgi:hypothetical protein
MSVGLSAKPRVQKFLTLILRLGGLKERRLAGLVASALDHFQLSFQDCKPVSNELWNSNMNSADNMELLRVGLLAFKFGLANAFPTSTMPVSKPLNRRFRLDIRPICGNPVGRVER